MELENMPPLEYILTSVEENKEFWDKTDIPLGSIHFGHEIFEEDKNSVSIKHTVRLESSIINEENIEFLRGIFSDVPHSMMLLKKSVEKIYKIKHRDFSKKIIALVSDVEKIQEMIDETPQNLKKIQLEKQTRKKI